MSEVSHGEDIDAVLAIDASNAFSSLNRMTGLHNNLVTCPIIAPYAVNTYRNPAHLFVVGGHELYLQKEQLRVILYQWHSME